MSGQLLSLPSFHGPGSPHAQFAAALLSPLRLSANSLCRSHSALASSHASESLPNQGNPGMGGQLGSAMHSTSLVMISHKALATPMSIAMPAQSSVCSPHLPGECSSS